MSDKKELTATQQAILYKKKDHPDWANTEIAESVGCSDSHVSSTLKRWNPTEMNSDGTVGGSKNPSLLFWFLVQAPIGIAIWFLKASIAVTLTSIKLTLGLTLWAIELPFRILGALFGSSK
ncbi:hypothetical protein [Halogeometricum limi]|uniref:Uncharacterized protein n=1 Tax=Halogeometricum limi TaxID=555875 RepID=A0A1I6FTU9_9EURY|nr:hypothetical protein [Halogeometricum limi]SFR33359.1 hypothetical protein SAMN04488124_0288 [Halogeometricum limi]